jgi:hypothetical protein
VLTNGWGRPTDDECITIRSLDEPDSRLLMQAARHGDVETRRIIAGHVWATTGVLTNLSRDSEWLTRALIISHAATPDEVVVRLLTDPEPAVVNAAAIRLGLRAEVVPAADAPWALPKCLPKI